MIASTATGIDADTVIPTFKNRYNDDAPKMIPSREPRATAENVSSGNWALAGMYGWNVVVPGSPELKVDAAAAGAGADISGGSPAVS